LFVCVYVPWILMKAFGSLMEIHWLGYDSFITIGLVFILLVSSVNIILISFCDCKLLYAPNKWYAGVFMQSYLQIAFWDLRWQIIVSFCTDMSPSNTVAAVCNWHDRTSGLVGH
jgi:hypothetical protein